jgi:hypothetical protein
MKITPKEELLMRRALDKAGSPAEAVKAAEAFVNSLRKRGIDGYEFVGKTEAPPPKPATAPKPPPPPPKPQPSEDAIAWSAVIRHSILTLSNFRVHASASASNLPRL